MSHSPLQAADRSQAGDYLRGTAQVSRMIRMGQNFSGYERNCAFLNTHNDRFANVSAVSGLDFEDDGRALLATDWDADGDTDLWMINRTGPRVRMMRNDQRDGRHFVAVRLEGVSCNRDAIGARVELHFEDAEQPMIMRTVRAGDGFLSQSTKWLHFGLGDRADIDRLVIRWPGGAAQTVKLPAVDVHYHIVQGEDAPRAVSPKTTGAALQHSPAESPLETQKVRTILGTRVAMPYLTYKDFDGNNVAIDAIRKGPQLINLWATWCQPCLTELKQLSRERARLREANLTVIALSVDGLGDDAPASQGKPATVLRRVGFDGRSGRASPQLLAKLELLYAHLFMDLKPFPIPTSFLVAPDGRLAAIYKGPIEVDQLMRDVEMLDAPAQAVRAYAHPAIGRWLSPPHVAPYIDLANAFIRERYFEDAIKFVGSYRRETGGVSPLYIRMVSRIGRAMAQAGRLDDAALLMISAIKQAPENPTLHFNLGVVEHERGRRDASVRAIERAIKLAQQRDLAEMAARFEAVLKQLRDDGS